jgi:hypothetical protein
MKPEDVEQLYERLSEEYGIPMPTYIIYDRRPKVLKPIVRKSWGEQVLFKITISRKIGSFFTLNPSIGEDPFGFIMLSKGRRGIRKDEAVHEFFHYLDHLINFFTGTRSVDEKSVRSRTRSQLKW